VAVFRETKGNAREFDLATQEWIDIPDKPVDLDKLRENIFRLWADALSDDDLPQTVRIRVARDAAPYLFAKYQAIARVGGHDLAEKMERALEATGKVISGRATQVIEKPAEVAVPVPLVSAEDMAKPMARLGTSRFRRF
jgi:hypothetical protein